MENTLLAGDYVLVNKAMPRDAIRGRPIVVCFPVDPDSYDDDASWSERVRGNHIGHALD